MNPMPNFRQICLVAALGATAPLALAQQATDLDCVRCVNAPELATNSVTARALRNNQVLPRHLRNGAVTADKLNLGGTTVSRTVACQPEDFVPRNGASLLNVTNTGRVHLADDPASEQLISCRVSLPTGATVTGARQRISFGAGRPAGSLRCFVFFETTNGTTQASARIDMNSPDPNGGSQLLDYVSGDLAALPLTLARPAGGVGSADVTCGLSVGGDPTHGIGITLIDYERSLAAELGLE